MDFVLTGKGIQMRESRRSSCAGADQCRRALYVLVLFASIFGSANAAHSLAFLGLELTDWQTLNVASGTSLTISTPEDIYLFGPNGFFGDNMDLRGGVGSSITVQSGVSVVVQDTFSLCISPVPCGASQPYDLATDLVINVLDPFVDLTISAGGDMVIGTTPIPEPSTTLLLTLGLLALGARRQP